MAKEPTAAYLVATGVLIARKGKETVTLKVGDPFTPADAEERDSLLAAGRIIPAADGWKLGQAGAMRAGGAQLAAQVAKAEGAEARAAEAEAKLAKVVAVLTDEQKASLAAVLGG